MRYFLAIMTLCCGAAIGYANEAEPQDAPEEVVIIDEPGGDESSEEVAAGINSKKGSKPKRGCGCGGK